ncbi:nicotinamidase-related amidase [Chitinivorax tropicus]|uniref:Nicotinamidase-related amidase n=1 Tax=Chitinivorax tropicus TaxID=714531 RepID=A0A840MSC0_9PROT|nr:isochorismatase family protein [Chitinivorax tropicus]MBB5018111.1 nicotinamidase-related amidase [Chitinivorax tropicus]
MSQNTALLVIDVQQSFLHRPYFREAAMHPYQERQLALIAAAEAAGVPIVHIFHSDESEPGGPFSRSSGLVKAMAWLPDNAAVTFEKHVHNAFTDTQLGAWLTGRGIHHLVISGLRTEQCCETTARVASDMGYEVSYVTEATGTFPMTHPVSGREFSVDEIQEKTELVLANRFANIRTVEDMAAAWRQVAVAG